jgi:hypothetical protein
LLGSWALVSLMTAQVACGDGASDDEPTPDAEVIEVQLVFVTSTTHRGDFGGVEGADALCMERAGAAGLEGTFRAWLSTVDTPVTERLTQGTAPYVRVDGVQVAADWDGLTAGSLEVPIDLDESGVPQFGDVWTGTLPDGTSYADGDCEEWTADASPAVSLCGRATSAGPQWTNNQQVACGASLRLYCIQQ